MSGFDWVMLPDTGRHVNQSQAGMADAWGDNGYQPRHAAVIPVAGEHGPVSDIPVNPEGWCWE